jgi:hypothetical protein
MGYANAQTAEPEYIFVIFETTVTRQGVETSDEHPEERRFYVSNIIALPSSDQLLLRRASKIADAYFIAAVVEPLKTKGILHAYYDDAIRINDNAVYRLDTRADVEALRKEVLDDLIGQNANIFTYNWKYGDERVGLDISRPTLFYHQAKHPLYGVGDKKQDASMAAPAAPKQKKHLRTN